MRKFIRKIIGSYIKTIITEYEIILRLINIDMYYLLKYLYHIYI